MNQGHSGFNRIELLLIHINNIVEKILALFVLAIFFFLFLQVIFRYVLGLPLYWVEELVKYLMIYTTTIGGAIAYRRYGHPSIVIAYNAIGLPKRMYYEILLRLPVMGLMGVFTVIGYQYARANEWMTTSGMEVSFFWPFLGIPIGGGLILLVLVLDTADLLFYRRSWLMDVNVPSTPNE